MAPEIMQMEKARRSCSTSPKARDPINGHMKNSAHMP
jgi:hypothetical protein